MKAKVGIEKLVMNKLWVVSLLILSAGFFLSFAGTFKRMMLYLSPNSSSNLNYSMNIKTSNRQEAKAVFPQVSGFNLLGEKFNFPSDFAASYNAVILAYSQEQQSDVLTWIPLLKQAEADFSGIRYYELPTLPEFNVAARAQLDRWMIEGIPDEDTRARTITLYLDVAAFNNALDIENTKEIQILLVNKEGKVVWQQQGRFSQSKGENLQQRLKELMEKKA